MTSITSSGANALPPNCFNVNGTSGTSSSASATASDAKKNSGGSDSSPASSASASSVNASSANGVLPYDQIPWSSNFEANRLVSGQTAQAAQRGENSAPSTPGVPPGPTAAAASVGDPLKTPEGKDKVYVLHSGLNDPENSGAMGIRAGLLAKGIPDERIVILPNEFPSFKDTKGIRRNLENFGEFGKSDSAQAQKAYEQMQALIAQKGLDPKAVSVTMVSHSGGGQASFGMAEIDKKTNNEIDQIITLGSPILKNNVDPRVKVTSVISPEDPIVRLTTGGLARLLGPALTGGKPKAVADNLDSNDKVIEIPNLEHHAYFRDPGIMNMVA
ncbi:MAG: hypothetical protein K2X66_03290, partial [Cyanobacteria bacterium]|nr:hypothetical protein [Cyanobacteriota bacterium]